MKPIRIFMFFVIISGILLVADSFELKRKEMVENQIKKRGIIDKRIVDAFLKVKRHLFVPAEYIFQAYDDKPLPIGYGQTISQPYIVAIMTYVIAPDYNKKVLEIGTGSGYQAAILAEIVKEVYTIEIKKEIADKAKSRLIKMGYKNIKFKTGDGYLGWKEYAPFDGIIVTCSPDHIPPPLIEQLAVGGKMVIPVRYTSNVQELILIEKSRDNKLKRTNLIPVQFVPLIRSR